MDGQENGKIGLNQALRMITARIGEIRVPVREREIAAALETIAGELMECVAAIESQATEQRAEQATEEEEAAAEDV